MRVRRCAWAVQVRADTHSLASSIVLSVFFIVSFAFVSLIVIMSLRTVTLSVVDGMHNVWTMHVPRAQRRWQAHCRARSRRMCQRRAGRRSASGQCLKHHIQLLTCTCKRVLPRESMCTAGEARTHGACVTSVLCTRVLVCKAQSSERGRGSGEATCLSALCAQKVAPRTARCRTRSVHTCRFGLFFCSAQEQNGSSKNAKRAYIARSV